MTPNAELTMCLCNFARTEQTNQIIDELKAQSIPISVWVWNNNPDIFFQHKGADLIINCSRNMHVKHVPALWQMASTPYIGRMDDDLHFADTHVIEDALAVLRLQRHSTQLVGAYGVRVFQDSLYTDGHHVSIPKGHGQYKSEDGPVKDAPDNIKVDIVKGRFMLGNVFAATNLFCNCPNYHVDLYISNSLAGQRRFHHVLAGCLFDRATEQPRLLDFPVDGKGYCDMGDHDEMRDKITKQWLTACQPDARVKKKPPKKQPDPDVPGQMQSSK